MPAVLQHRTMMERNQQQQQQHAEHDENGGEEQIQQRKRFARSSQACVYCRHLKMKCSGTVPCDRCLRNGRKCEESRRPTRGSWSRKKDVEIQTLSQRLEEMEQRVGKTSAQAISPPKIGQQEYFAQRRASQMMNLINAPQPLESNGMLDSTLSHLPFVSTGTLSAEEAAYMYTGFMHNCLQHVPLLDPEWHSLQRVSISCPFLFACIVNVAAIYYSPRPDLRQEMQSEINALIGNLITSGVKNVGIIQGFLILYFWNQPCADLNYDLAWTYSGLGMRMAAELNLSTSSSKGKEPESEADRINRERTWMFCFLVDRTQSAARGKKWSLHGSDSIVGNAASWFSQSICRPWDLGISALADLLKVTSRQTDVLNDCLLTASEFNNSNSNFQCDTTMRVLNNELQQWKKGWFAKGFFTSPLGDDAIIDQASPLGSDAIEVHARTLHYITRQASLRYYYAVLVLNCAGLQYYATHPEKSEGKTYILMHAMQAAQGIVTAAKDGLRSTVAYSPQTQCTIISFAIISLIKMAPLMRDDLLTSDRLIQLAISGITFLESVALRPTHLPARFASMLRGLLRKSSHQTDMTAAFRPGMEVHSLPMRSSRAVTPNREMLPAILPPSSSAFKQPSSTSDGLQHDFKAEASEDAELNSNHTPTSFTLFGMDGSTGLGQMTADQILDESFWLCMPPFSPTTPWE